MYLVHLVVSDGSMLSNPNTFQAAQYVRVGGAAAIDLPIIGRTPYGGNVSLGDPHIDIRLSLSSADSPNVEISKLGFQVDPVGGHFTLAVNAWKGATSWRIADEVTITITDIDMPGWSTQVHFTMSDDMISGVAPAEFLLPMPYRPTVTASPSPSGDATDDFDPIYIDTTSHFKGTGHVAYIDGFHADSVQYGLWIRVLPLYTNAHGGHTDGGEALRNGTSGVPLSDPTGIVGWCELSTGTTDVNGDLTWDIRRDEYTCGSTELPVGHYEVAIRVSSILGTPAVSPPAELYVDITPGHVLANNYIP
jgi:hypothetical protein